MYVVMTGATGYFGSHFLAALLAARPRARVVALVRDVPSAARTRLRAAVKHTGYPLPDDALERVTLLHARLDAPRLGLPAGEYRWLTERAAMICHFAGHIGLNARIEALRAVNVTGTAHVLRLAAACPPTTRLVHVSTAFVAGARRHGIAPERTVWPAEGFLSPYEESKYEAECLVHDYCRIQRRGALIVRPGILVTDRPFHPDAPTHPLGALAARVAQLPRRVGKIRGGPLFSAAAPVTVRVLGSPQATLNLLQTPYAADAMVHLTTRVRPVRPGNARVLHLVHPDNTPVQLLLDALASQLPGLTVTLTAQLPNPTPLESLLTRLSNGAHLYTSLHRHYERTAALRVLAHLPVPPRPTSDYLERAFALAHLVTTV